MNKNIFLFVVSVIAIIVSCAILTSPIIVALYCFVFNKYIACSFFIILFVINQIVISLKDSDIEIICNNINNIINGK